MSDRLDEIRAGLRDGRYDCRVPADTDDVRWLVREAERVRAMWCKTCKYSRWPGPGRMACKLYRCMVTPDHGCLAWEKRDD